MSTQKQPHPIYNLQAFLSLKELDRALIFIPSVLCLAFLVICALFFWVGYPFIAAPFFFYGVYLTWNSVKNNTWGILENELTTINDIEKIQLLKQQHFFFCAFMAAFPLSLSFCVFNSPITDGGENNLIFGLCVAFALSVLSIAITRLSFNGILLEIQEQRIEEEELKKML